MTILPEPDHEGGYTIEFIRSYLSTSQLEEFSAWMYGQTMAYIDGKSIVYEDDFKRWLEGHRTIYD